MNSMNLNQQMKQIRYRFNRKSGTIFKDDEGLIEVGDRLKTIILWASEPVWGKPFPHLSAQFWISLTFLDQQNNWCYALLNNGTTNALLSWVEYRKKIEEKGCELFGVVTEISLKPVDSDREWFEYSFSGVRGKPGLEERMRKLVASSPHPLLDLDLDLDL